MNSSRYSKDPASSERASITAAILRSSCRRARVIESASARGRSFSLGVADSVTVLAGNAAAADAAATLIGNAVNCEHPAIIRAPAEQLKDDTDLGARLVTVDVPSLPEPAIAAALSGGRAEAELWRDRGLIHAAAIFLQGRVSLVLHATQRPPCSYQRKRRKREPLSVLCI